MSESESDYMRDCFDDRICDDLCEVLLSYLSIDDKTHFQCVSKQWKHCVIKSQKHLNVFEFKNLLKTKRPELTTDELRNVLMKKLENILKKFTFINKIEISHHSNPDLNHSYIKDIIEWMVKYCNHLKEISIASNVAKKCIYKSFGQKFGQSLEKIVFYDKEFHVCKQILLKLCPNLISIENISLNDFSVKNQITVLKNLKHIIDFGFDKNNVLNDILFEDFVNKYKNQIKNIGFEGNFIFDNLLSVLGQISKFNKLEKLDLTHYYGIVFTDEIIQSFEIFSLQCKQLKCLKLKFSVKTSDQTKNVLKCFSNFGNLTKLVLCLNCVPEYQQIINDFNMKCESFGKLINISHLIIRSTLLSDKFFNDIEKYLPNLRAIQLYDNKNYFTDNALYSLSKLENIKKIDLSNTRFTDIALISLINNCLKLRYVSFYCIINTTNETIDEIISLLSKRGNNKFVLKLNFGENTENFRSKVESIPNIEFKSCYFVENSDHSNEDSDEDSDEDSLYDWDEDWGEDGWVGDWDEDWYLNWYPYSGEDLNDG